MIKQHNLKPFNFVQIITYNEIRVIVFFMSKAIQNPTNMPLTEDADEAKKGKDDIIATLENQFAKTNAKIETVQTTLDEQIGGIKNDLDSHGARITQLEAYTATDARRINQIEIQLEILRQDRLRNNLRLTGLPLEACDNPAQTTMKIVETLHIQLLPSDFVAYSDRNKSSIILQFDNYAHKRYFMDAMRKKKCC